MANNVGDDIGIADDSEIETPPAVDPRPATCHRPRCRRVSSSRFRFSPSPPAAPDIGLDRSGHLFRSIDRAQDAAVPDVFVGLCQPGINNAALCRGVLIMGVGKLGAVNHQLGCEHHLAAFGYADRGAETAGNVIWPLRWILTRVVTKQKFPSVRKSESRTSEESIAVLALASPGRCWAGSLAWPNRRAAHALRVCATVAQFL